MSIAPPTSPSLNAAREKILASMRRRHFVEGNDAWMLIAGGGVVLVLFGAVAAFLMMLVHASLAGWENAWRVRTFFGLSLLIMFVLLAVQERRTRGTFFSFAADDIDLRRDPDNTAEYLLDRSRTHLASLIEYGGWPVRAVIAGVRGLLGVKPAALESILSEAADVLARMLSIDAGIKLTQLAPAGTDPMQLMPILRWLDAHDYIGFSTRGDKVWVSSTAKKRFAEDGIVVPRAESVVSSPTANAHQTPGKADQGPIELA